MLSSCCTLFRDESSSKPEESLPLTRLFLDVKELARKLADNTATREEKEQYTRLITQIAKDRQVSKEDRLALADFMAKIAEEMSAARRSAAPR